METVVTVIDNGKLLKPQTLNEENKLTPYFETIEKDEAGNQNLTSQSEDWDYKMSGFNSKASYLASIQRNLVETNDIPVGSYYTISQADSKFATKSELKNKYYSALQVEQLLDKKTTEEQVLSLIAQSQFLEKKIVNDLSEINNTQYLYLLKDGDKYNTYLYINKEPVLIGNTEINLSDYYNKGTVDEKIETIETKANSILDSGIEVKVVYDDGTEGNFVFYGEQR